MKAGLARPGLRGASNLAGPVPDLNRGHAPVKRSGVGLAALSARRRIGIPSPTLKVASRRLRSRRLSAEPSLRWVSRLGINALPAGLCELPRRRRSRHPVGDYPAETCAGSGHRLAWLHRRGRSPPVSRETPGWVWCFEVCRGLRSTEGCLLDHFCGRSTRWSSLAIRLIGSTDLSERWTRSALCPLWASTSVGLQRVVRANEASCRCAGERLRFLCSAQTMLHQWAGGDCNSDCGGVAPVPGGDRGRCVVNSTFSRSRTEHDQN